MLCEFRFWSTNPLMNISSSRFSTQPKHIIIPFGSSSTTMPLRTNASLEIDTRVHLKLRRKIWKSTNIFDYFRNTHNELISAKRYKRTQVTDHCRALMPTKHTRFTPTISSCHQYSHKIEYSSEFPLLPIWHQIYYIETNHSTINSKYYKKTEK